MSNIIGNTNTQFELLNFKHKIDMERQREANQGEMIITEMFMATVKSVNSKTLTVDVFIAKLNTEVKNVQVIMPTMSPEGGRLSLPQVNSAVIIVFASYMKPFILATIPFIDAKIPEIHKQESLEYTNNTCTKHTFNGDILNIAGSRNADILKSDGSKQVYNSDNVEYSEDCFNIKAINEMLGSMEYEKINIGNAGDDINPIIFEPTKDRLINLREKLIEHKAALYSLKNQITSNGLDKDSILNSVSQLRTLLYNEYKGSDYYIETQKGYVLNKEIENIEDIKKATEKDVKYSVHGKKLIYQTVCNTSEGGLSISIDEDRNIDIDCNKFTINGREVFRYD